jgi:hypothetical protein
MYSKHIRYGVSSRLVVLPIHASACEHPEEASAAALSAQLPTALILQITCSASKNCWYSSEVN